MDIVEMRVPSVHGDVPVRVYDVGGRRRPAMVWNHGGAWALGSLDMVEADGVARRFADAIEGVVVSVDYTLVPKARHPQPVEEIIAVFDWVVASADTLGIDATGVGLGGASAGGHLAACAALVLRDRPGAQVVPAALVLVYPGVDPMDGPYGPKPDDIPDELWLGQERTSDLFAAYVAGVDLAACPVPAVPAKADLSGLPPTLVTTAGRDGLRPQGEEFVKRLADAGVAVEHHEETRKYHGYANNVSASCDAAVDRHAAWLHRRIG